MRMRVCHLVFHEVALYYYLVIHRKPITSITVVRLPFVTYLVSTESPSCIVHVTVEALISIKLMIYA
jgi:hypothetical protein